MGRGTTAALMLAALLAVSAGGCSSTPTEPSAAQAIDDGVVTARVKAALIEDPITKAHNINVETFKGSVQLSGFVENDETRSRALKLARNIKGVRQVRDAMEMRKRQS